MLSRQVINQLSIYVCSAIVLLGILGNFVSFLVFIRSGRHNPRMVTRNLLLLLTITNSTYLIFYWLHRILPRVIETFTYNSTASSSIPLIDHLSSFEFILANRNIYSCRIITYIINVAICLNATVTVSFSIERALAINFPFATRDLRKNYKTFFKYLVIAIIIFSFLFPIYNLVLLELTQNKVCIYLRLCLPLGKLSNL